MFDSEFFIQRCFDLAKSGIGATSPNPCVGAVLVYEGRIIGEGYHERYGMAHAEVNALASVKAADRHLIPKSTLYVSLEPCCIYGNTPPCTSLIIENQIPKVVIASLDRTPGVDGRGLELLRQAGVEVVSGVLQDKGDRLSAPRNVFVTKKRPYIILKYAKTANGFMAPSGRRQAWITSPYTRRLVHKWRSEADAIMIGTQTAIIDNPELTTRYYFGKSPLRIVIDQKGILPDSLAVFNAHAKTLIVTAAEPMQPIQGVEYLLISDWRALLDDLLSCLYQKKCGILLVEGGPGLLSGFINAGLWDEARVFTGQMNWAEGLPAPTLPFFASSRHELGKDLLEIFFNS